MRRRRIRGSRGPFVILLVLIILCAGAVFIGKYIQDNFIDVVLPPNPTRQAPQM
jgi:uncharacterized membrane protein